MLKDRRQKKACVFVWCVCAAVLFFSVCVLADEFTYDSQGKRNPFIPLVTPDGRLLKIEEEQDKSAVVLQGILYDEAGDSYCLINGRVIKVGDTINDHQVLKIEKEKVIFIREGQLIEIGLKKEVP